MSRAIKWPLIFRNNFLIDYISHAVTILVEKNMAESEWTIFLELVECTCGEVEHRIHSSDSSTLQDFLFRLQANRTACERIIGATVDVHVDTSVSENI